MSKANEFQSEIGRFLNTYFIDVYRYDDVSFNRYFTRQVSPKPFDYFGADCKGLFFTAEVKRVKQERFSFALLKPHQEQILIDSINKAQHAWLFINWRFYRSGIAAWLPAEHYLKLKENSTYKSLHHSDVDSKFYLKRTGGEWVLTREHPLRNYANYL